ncbi:transmembrane 220 family protein [Aquirufa sp. ROCK2-A2]
MQKLIFVLGVLFTITFLLFTYWQLNDPDPILWVPIYGVASYSGLQAVRNKINSELMLILLLLSFTAGLQTWLQMDAWEGFLTDGLSMKTHNQELAREAVGLWIGSLSFASFYGLSKVK